MNPVIGWDKCFEGAKSKTYSNKSSCQMPTSGLLTLTEMLADAQVHRCGAPRPRNAPIMAR